MTSKEYILKLRNTESVEIQEPLIEKAVDDFFRSNHLTLPKDHIDFLKLCDGIFSFGRYFRLFGISDQNKFNLISWNSRDLWKFAWQGKLDDFLCFGETAWGDQYAYRLSDLKKNSNPEVFFIEGLTMEPEAIHQGFTDFLENEFYNNSVVPYDELIKEARLKLGDLSVETHINYIPSLLLGGSEDIDCIFKQNAVDSMIINGDIYTQTKDLIEDKSIKELVTYKDSKNRERIKIIWE